MPDGSVLKGAQGNNPFDRFEAFEEELSIAHKLSAAISSERDRRRQVRRTGVFRGWPRSTRASVCEVARGSSQRVESDSTGSAGADWDKQSVSGPNPKTLSRYSCSCQCFCGGKLPPPSHRAVFAFWKTAQNGGWEAFRVYESLQV